MQAVTVIQVDTAKIGKQGGLRRAENMTAAERSASARKAARARWGPKKNAVKKGGKKK
jgi:hypothetical protein